jgi:hypothetical protein
MRNAECGIQNSEWIRILHSAFCTLNSAFIVLVVVALGPTAGGAQDIGPITFRDSLVMRQLVYRAPCPVPVPPSWSMMDSTLGRGPRCSIVEVAARHLAQSFQARPPDAYNADPWNALCVRVLVARNTGSTGLPGDWLVLFDLDMRLRAHVLIDRQTGTVAAVRTIHGSMIGDSGPFCADRR